jgi:RHS repeat-associated protein
MKPTIRLQKILSYILLPVMVLFTFQSAFADNYDKQQSLTINNSSLTINTNPFKYSGYYQDSESRLYYLKARYYSPELMRFINRDSYDLSNRYAYGNGDPINNIDSNGHMAHWLDIGLGVLATAAGVLMALGTGGGSAIVGMGVSAALAGGVGTGIDQGLTYSHTIKQGGMADEALQWGSLGISLALGLAGGLTLMGNAAESGERELAECSTGLKKAYRDLNASPTSYFTEDGEQLVIDVRRMNLKSETPFTQRIRALAEEGDGEKLKESLSEDQRICIHQGSRTPAAAISMGYKISLIENIGDAAEADDHYFTSDLTTNVQNVDSRIRITTNVVGLRSRTSCEYIGGMEDTSRNNLARKFVRGCTRRLYEFDGLHRSPYEIMHM